MSTIQITDAGAALMQNATEPIVLTSFKLGSAYGYTPTSGQTNIQGSLVYTGVPGAPVVQDANVLLYPVYLTDSLGPFSFGEVGLFYNSTLFAILVLDALETKLPKDLNTNTGGSLVIDMFAPMVGSNYQMWANVTQSNTNKASVAQGPENLPYSVLANPNLWVVQAAGAGRSFLAYSDRQGLWNFSSFEPTQQASIISASSNTVVLSAADFGSLTFDGLGTLLLQVKTGRAAASCRYVSSMSVDGSTGNIVLGVSASWAKSPQAGDLFEIYLPTGASQSGGGGGIDPSNLPDLPSTAQTTDKLAIVRGGQGYGWSLANMETWLSQVGGFNRPPTGTDKTAGGVDTTQSLTGNLYTGIVDPDGDAVTLQSITYTAPSSLPVAFDPNNGTYQAYYGLFFLDPTTGIWTYSLGPNARALTTGQTGTEIFTYIMADGKGGIRTNHLTISITGSNSAPIVAFVNGGTPMNTTLTGNLLYRLAFDYESTVTISGYSIAGQGGTFTGGPTTINGGVGTITIQTNGDYTFAPAQDYFGPVPTITYNVTDGVNIVPAKLTLAVTPLISGTQPLVLGTDIVSGPTSGGENNDGIYLTLFGYRFGLQADLGTNIKVYIGGVEVARYIQLVSDPLSAKFPGLQRLSVQVGALGGAAQGIPQHITVVSSGQTSNADSIFTPNPGDIYFVSHAGNDTTGVKNDITHPFRMLQYGARGTRSPYALMQAGDCIVIIDSDGQPWTDTGYDTAWLRFRDPQQQGSAPSGTVGTGWVTIMGYPGQTIHYITQPGTKGGIQGPGQAFTGTTGDWVQISNLKIEVLGGATRDAGPVNMQYNAERWRIVGNDFGPWVAGNSPVLNCAAISGEGNFIYIAFNKMHDIEGTVDLQNHGIYAGTSSYGWEICYNWIFNCVGGSHIQFNDSDGGSNIFLTPYGVWTGFTNIKIHNNWMENAAKYAITFSDSGGTTHGELDFQAWNNIIVKTQLAPLRLQTVTDTSDCTYAFNTVYNCCTLSSATGNAYLRNEGVQTSPNHIIRAYNNIFAFGPDTVSGCSWLIADAEGFGGVTGYALSRNLYFANGQSPANAPDGSGIYADPLFNNAAAGDFSLQTGSPALNVGTQSLPAGLVVQDDFSGLNTRRYGGAPDIGAVEKAQSTPFVTSNPTFSGGPTVGTATSVTIGSWGNAPTTYSRQFQINGSNVGSAIAGTGSATYTPVYSDVRQVLTCIISATNVPGTSQYTLAIGTIAQAAGGPTNTVAPVISGTAQVGNVLTVTSNGTWTGTNSGYLYQWFTNVSGTIAAIGGATASTYTLTNSEIGAKVFCQVEAENTTTGSGIANSNLSNTVIAGSANPLTVQSKGGAPGSNVDTTITFDSSVSANNGIVLFTATWDNAMSNGKFSDNQGNGYGVGTSGVGYTLTSFNGTVDNPNSQIAYAKTNAGGTYTTTYNPSSANGVSFVQVEVSGIDQTTFIDQPMFHNAGTDLVPTITATVANTKPTDLVYVWVTARGVSAVITGDPGYTLVKSQAGSFHTSSLFQKKESGIETVTFTGSIDATSGWIIQVLVLRGA